MNTNYDKVKSFIEAITPKTDADRLEFEAQKIHLDFMFLLKDLMAKHNLSKKDLASLLGVAPSYITQLFNASRLINLKTIARLQQIFDLKFKIVPAKEVPFRYKKQLKKYKIDQVNFNDKSIAAA